MSQLNSPSIPGNQSTGQDLHFGGQVAADPHDRCLVTNTDYALERCQLVSSATPLDIVRRLQTAWHQTYPLDLDTCYNVFPLKADWHCLFDEDRWMLIPELTVLETLRTLTLSDYRGDNPLETFRGRIFQYHLLPLPGLHGPIIRFDDPSTNNIHQMGHQGHDYPFQNLGLLSSQIHPQYVVFNSGEKLSKLSAVEFIRLQSVLDMVSGQTDLRACMIRLHLVLWLHRKWIEAISNDSNNLYRFGHVNGDDACTNSSVLSRPSRSGHQHGHGNQRTPSIESLASRTTDDNIFEDPAWKEDMCSWAEECTEAASSNDRWVASVLNDDQVVAHAKEPSRPAPPPETWQTWHEWRDRWEPRPIGGGVIVPFETEKWSSNDWASYWFDCYLTMHRHSAET